MQVKLVGRWYHLGTRYCTSRCQSFQGERFTVRQLRWERYFVSLFSTTAPSAGQHYAPGRRRGRGALEAPRGRLRPRAARRTTRCPFTPSVLVPPLRSASTKLGKHKFSLGSVQSTQSNVPTDVKYEHPPSDSSEALLWRVHGMTWSQGLTLVHFSAQHDTKYTLNTP
jgi:hypothetical protein